MAKRRSAARVAEGLRQLGQPDTVDLDDLSAPARAPDDADALTAHVEAIRKEPDDRLIRCPVYRGSCDPDFERLAMEPDDFGA
jgi:hypothetical protein